MNNTSRPLPSPIRNYIASQAEINIPYTNIVRSVEQKYDRTTIKRNYNQDKGQV